MKNITLKRIKTLLSFILLFCMLCGCATKEAVSLHVDTADTSVTSDTDVTGATAEPKPTEPVEQFLNRPQVQSRVQNKYDAFTPGEITVNNSDFVLSAQAEASLYDAIRSTGYKVGFYVIDLKSGMSIGYNADEYFNPACTRKAGFALSWFKMLEDTRKQVEGGNPLYMGDNAYVLESGYYYDGRDYLEGAGYVGRHGYRWYTVEELLYHLINVSDNTAYKALWRILGINRYKSLCVQLGIPEHPDEYRRDEYWTPMRPHDIGLVWQEIWRYKDKDCPEAKAMWQFFTHNEYNEIVKVVKDADIIAHKSGSDEMGNHDAGIVVRGDDAYVVVAMSTVPLSVVRENHDVIHRLFESIDIIMQGYYESQEK